MSYFGDLVAQGATGTQDPAAAGLGPDLNAPVSEYGPLADYLRSLISRRDPAQPGNPWEQPGYRRFDAPAIDPPEAVTPSPLPTAGPAPAAAAAPQQFSPGGADARVLAQLSGGPTYPAQDLGINLIGGPQRGDYADLRTRLAAGQPAGPGAARPAPAPAPLSSEPGST